MARRDPNVFPILVIISIGSSKSDGDTKRMTWPSGEVDNHEVMTNVIRIPASYVVNGRGTGMNVMSPAS
jgi:hypothetical protein